MHRHTHIHCIVPPHMLKEISEKGTPTQKELAVKTLTTSEQLRGSRRALSELGKASMFRDLLAGKDRTVYDAQNGNTLPGAVVRKEGDPAVADVAINEAYDGSGFTYDFFKDAYDRDSINGSGLPLKSTVHYQKGYDNAFWDGQQMVYGDGDENLPVDERLFNRFTIALDIIGHELAHGVTQYEADLAYMQQSGALNESMSDVFGSLVKQHHRRQTADAADWVIGEGLLTANVNGVGIRSMKAPGTAYNDPVLGKDPQPAHMKDYVNTASDNGGVHINSGIPNYAFYRTALELGGFAWEKAGRIWYVTLKDKLSASSNFEQCANLTYQVAGDLFGANSLEQMAVKNGWAAVGLGVDAAPPSGGSGDGCFGAALRLIGAAPSK